MLKTGQKKYPKKQGVSKQSKQFLLSTELLKGIRSVFSQPHQRTIEVLMDHEVYPQYRPPFHTMQVPECPVCWDIFNDDARMPRILRCGHTICESCLDHLPVDSRLGQQCLHCPECRSPCLWKGVRELPKNFILLRAISITSQAGASHMEEGYMSFISDLPIFFSLSHFISTETRWLHRIIKRKFRDATRLFCLAALLLLLVPLALAHMLLAWWVAALGLLLLIWFTVGGFGLAVFIFCMWGSYNSLYILSRLNWPSRMKWTQPQWYYITRHFRRAALYRSWWAAWLDTSNLHGKCTWISKQISEILIVGLILESAANPSFLLDKGKTYYLVSLPPVSLSTSVLNIS